MFLFCFTKYYNIIQVTHHEISTSHEYLVYEKLKIRLGLTESKRHPFELPFPHWDDKHRFSL